MKIMLPGWLKAHEAVEAGCQLADAFPTTGAGDAVRDFLARAAREIQLRKLSFYKRVRFANAFKWRLRENGIEAETAREVTQTLLLRVLMPGDHGGEAIAASATALPKPEKGRRRAELARQAEKAWAEGDYPTALARYQELLASRPRDADALNDLGAVLMKLGRYEEARERFRAAIAREPNHREAQSNLGVLLLLLGDFQDAENCFRRALILKATDVTARSNLGLVFVNTGRLEDARSEFDKVLRIAPRHADTLFGLGMLARSEGKFDEAEEMLRRALVANPQMPRAWAALAGIRKMTRSDRVWLKRAEQTAAGLKSVHEQADVRFAIGKYFDDLGKHSQAFESYRQANELLKTLAPPYEAAASSRFVDDMMRLYTPERIAQAAGASDSDRPIFVVGMPRSGTSLVEQILASHPAVGGAGELPFWNDVMRRHEAQVTQQVLTLQTRRKIAENYLRTLSYHCPDSRYVVDKTPLNCDYLGPIHSVFPKARIIYVRRNPIDTGLSCYFQNFNVTLSWSLDLSDIARYYTQHLRLYRHWRAVLPAGSILEVPYEELVSNQEAWTRTLLDFLGLEWDERCLQFHKTQRAVVTASYWQVRQPLYGDSVQRWRKYSKFIGPLRELQSTLERTPPPDIRASR